MIFNNVLFPAPFFPIIPTTSPGSTEKLTSSNAVNFLYFNFPLNKATTVSFKLMILSFAMLNCIVTWLTSIIVICLNPSIFYIYNTKRFWNFLNIQAPTIKVPNENNKQYKYSSGVGDTPSIKIILINFI